MGGYGKEEPQKEEQAAKIEEWWIIKKKNKDKMTHNMVTSARTKVMRWCRISRNLILHKHLREQEQVLAVKHHFMSQVDLSLPVIYLDICSTETIIQTDRALVIKWTMS